MACTNSSINARQIASTPVKQFLKGRTSTVRYQDASIAAVLVMVLAYAGTVFAISEPGLGEFLTRQNLRPSRPGQVEFRT